MGKILYKELAYKVVGCFYKVYNTVGPGHKESVYHKALAIEFDSKRIKYEAQKRISMLCEERKVGDYVLDFIIDNKIIVEIKSVKNMLKVFEKQLFYYLKATQYRLGYLVNFGSDEIDIRRRIN